MHAIIPLTYLTMYILAYNNTLYDKKTENCVFDQYDIRNVNEPKVIGTTKSVDGEDILGIILFQE